MNALGLGLIAAFAWGFHDICVRFVSQRTPLLAALLWVLLAGLGLHLCIMAWHGPIDLPGGAPARMSVIAGLFFLIASLGLYGAFQRGPVRLVAPIIASYPILSVGWAAVQGVAVTPLQWGAVIAIVFGVSGVAALSDTQRDATPPKGRTIFYAGLSACGFAGTFAFGQSAAESAGELSSTLVARLVATGLLIVLIGSLRQPFWPGRRALPVLVLMGLADGLAFYCVMAAGTLPNAHFASVAASIFGLLTIVMAWALLRETMRPLQWIGCAVTFCGVAYLAL